MKAPRQLCNTETRADEDSQSRDAQTAQEGFEQPALVQPGMLHRPRLRALPQPIRKLRTACREQCQREDLERQAGNHDIDAHLILGLSGRAARDPAARSLQDETEQITAAEDERVGAGPEAAEVFSVDDDDARQGEVDGGAEEGRRDGQADEVDEEVVAGRIERILVQENPRDVADYFAS